MAKKVLIAGAGLGGLATGLRLAKKGYSVEILEKNGKAGGRLNQLKKDGFTFDTGPSFFAMSYEFTDFAKDCNITLPFKYYSLDPLYTVSFRNSDKVYHLFKDLHKLAAEFREEEPGFEQAMRKYLDKCRRLYYDTNVVIKNNYDSLLHYALTLPQVGPAHVGTLFRSFWSQVSRYFKSNEAREILSLVAFFLGRTPFDTPATYTLLSYTEFMHDGYFNVEGGMYKIVEGIVNELEKENVKISYNTEIVDFVAEGNKLKYLIDSEGKKWEADIMVINADAAVFRGKIFRRPEFSEEKLDRMEWTMGSLTIYLGIDRKLPDIQHHNYYLGTDYREYAGKVYSSAEIDEAPYYYVNVLSRSNPECAPPGCESLFFVCPVPDLRFKSSWHDRDQIVDRIIDDFSRRTGTDIRPHIVSRTVYTPEDWGDQFNLHRGSGLGLSHKMLQIGALRPKNFDEHFKNVFYTGASTIPGTGLPMVIIGSKLTTERVLKYNDQ
ncbi:MAG: phytoene desaturase [Bacteroidales bacterium]|nr:phytoene desaturase [Bacteroidales bacterium]MBN2632423.1 phytoene desaturase [Bacteroidales bacterium]